MNVPEVSRPPARRVPVLTIPRRSVRITFGPDPEVIARAGDLLRALDAATNTLTDVLDVTGFPVHERRKDMALLSTLASGLPAITLDEVIEALRDLAVGTGPAALFPGAEASLSLPDEARELLYIVEPLAVLTQPGRRLPRHAGERLRAAPLLFSLSQPRTSAALVEVVAVLRQIVRLPLAQPELTTIRPSRVQPLTRPRGGRRESTALADIILVLALLLGIVGILVILSLLTRTVFPIP